MIDQFDAAALLGAVLKKAGPVSVSQLDFVSVSGGKITVEYEPTTETYTFTYEDGDTDEL